MPFASLAARAVPIVFDRLPDLRVRLAGVLMAVLEVWQSRRERARQRHQLLAMDDRMLRDIGVSRCDATQGVPRVIYRP